ncbi:DDRRRQL repeat protein YjdP [Escherichia albertii]|uniref:DDRRRQL repeat protein YjdP n=1 Tax=Escherichia albertii TaxID=208962 RepID=UPI0010F7ABBD|nr:DDRRRQL repeat protein YjdP [Escherichia albertii]
MKPYSTLFLFSLLTLTTVPTQADIIDDTIGNIQQAINDAYNPDRGRDYDDSRGDGWQREVSDDRRRQYDDRRRQFEDRRRQYDDRRRQFEDRRRQLDDRQRQLDQERRQLEDEARRMEEEYRR